MAAIQTDQVTKLNVQEAATYLRVSKSFLDKLRVKSPSEKFGFLISGLVRGA